MRSMRIRSHPASGGFTMIETLVALTVFGLGMLTLMQLAPRSTHSGIQGRRVTEAMSLAQAKLEELRSMPTASADLGAGTHVDTEDLGDYSRRWEVAGDDPIQGMKKVTVRVRFTTQSADSVAVITTYF